MPLPRIFFGFCISNGDFWCIPGAIFYSSDARFTHKKQRFGLEIGGQIHKLGVSSSRNTETANDTRNSLMENMFVSSLPSDVMRMRSTEPTEGCGDLPPILGYRTLDTLVPK